MPRPVHFELHAEDPARAVRFYEKVFGWKFEKYPGPMEYYLISTGDEVPGINGGLLKRPGPEALTVNTVGVASLDDSAAQVLANGGTEVVPKMPIPGVGWLAYFKDTEGIIFGIMQPDKAAA